MYKRSLLIYLIIFLTSCAYNTGGEKGTISDLDAVKLELKDVDVEDGLDKAMAGYQKFLEQTPESQLTPEAIRRLADLKIEKEYGVVTDEKGVTDSKTEIKDDDVSVTTKAESRISANAKKSDAKSASSSEGKESEKDFEKRATKGQKIESAKKENIELPKGVAGADLKNSGAEDAIKLYKKLLEKYPLYERNDQVLYQLSRAYEETGQVEEAMAVMNRLIKQYPNSRYNDEVNFRRGEYYFTRKKYLDAEDAYAEVLKMGVGTVYYDRALYKKGWTFYKQELYEEALQEFFTLLDHKVSIGYDFEQTEDKIEKKRIDDTFRVVSLSFSNLGGSDTLKEFFEKTGARDYEYYVYKELAEFYFDKRRYSDAAATYNTFADANPFHSKSPHFNMRVIEIYMKGGFPKLVIEAKKRYASTYGLKAEYWNYFNQADYPEVLGYLKTNLTDLANHYHSLYQNKKFVKNKQENFDEASHWYREFLESFPRAEESPAINYQLADLYLENKNFDLAAEEFERSAYDYPVNENSKKAAYAAVYSYREYLKNAPISQIKNVKREIIRTSLKLVDTFPDHEKATVVLGAATDDLFEMRDFTLAIKTGRRLIEEYPKADKKIIRGAWLVVAHSSYELEIYNDAEVAYIEVLALTANDDKSRVQLVDNLAASIYKQGEKARGEENYREAVRHFLRIADVAPSSKIRPSAEYDAAAVLIQIMDLEQAISVLQSFRSNYPGHKLQKDVTKKIAFSYKELGKYSLAAKEYERVAAEAEDEDLVREAMLQSAELYEKAKDVDNSLRVYKQFVAKFPKPLEFALDTYYKIAMIYKTQGDLTQYRKTLQHIIASDASAGGERTDRTRYLAAQSSLVIIEPKFDEYISISLVKPFKKSLKKKQQSMKSLVSEYTKLVDYEVADVTAASTFYIAEIYYNFNRSLLASEKPDGLSALELEEFNLMLEDQAYPFEEKAIKVHEKNIELLSLGLYSKWIDRSIEKLAKLVPARYNKPEEAITYISKIDNYIYSSPRYIREDATTGFIKSLGFFRYRSQNAEANHNQKQENVDTVTDESQNMGGIGAANANVSETQEGENSGQQITETKDAGVAPTGFNTDEVTAPVKEATTGNVTAPAVVPVTGEMATPTTETETTVTTESKVSTEAESATVTPTENNTGEEAVPATEAGAETEATVTPEPTVSTDPGDASVPPTGVGTETTVVPESTVGAEPTDTSVQPPETEPVDQSTVTRQEEVVVQPEATSGNETLIDGAEDSTEKVNGDTVNSERTESESAEVKQPVSESTAPSENTVSQEPPENPVPQEPAENQKPAQTQSSESEQVKTNVTDKKEETVNKEPASAESETPTTDSSNVQEPASGSEEAEQSEKAGQEEKAVVPETSM